MAAGPFHVLRHRDFRLYAGGMAVSLAGSAMQQLAQSWLIYRLTHSEWLLGLTWFCSNIPILFLSPLTGVIADRFPRRRIIILAQTAAMLQAIVLAALTLTGHIQVWHVLTLATLLGVANAFDIPARQSLFIHLVGKEDLIGAISLNSATFNSARVIGPSIAGLLVARFGEGPCFALNAASFVAVLGSLLAMRVREAPAPPSTESPLERLRSGLRYAWRTRAVRVLLITAGAISLSAAPSITLAPIFADAIFHRGSTGLGLLTACMGAGAILGTLNLAVSRGASKLYHIIFTAAAGTGIGALAFAWSPLFPLSLAIITAVGASQFRLNASTNTAIQSRIDDSYRGRVMGLFSMMVVGMFPVGSLLAGALATAAGARCTVTLGGLSSLLAAGYVYSERRTLRTWLEP
jgi:MFS family permease